MEKNKKRILIIVFLLLLGIGYNLYTIFKPAKKRELTKIDMESELENLPADLKEKLKTQFNNIDKNSLKELEVDAEFQEFLEKADVILNDSMNCDCPDVKKRMKEKLKNN